MIQPRLSEGLLDPSFFALRELFEGPLSAVAFPGVDAANVTTLVTRAEEGAIALEAAREALAQAQADVAAAESTFQARRGALLAKGQQALAYARVFAQDDPSLLASIDAIALPKSRTAVAAAGAGPAAPKKRGRPPKTARAAEAVASGEGAVAAE